jgi:hypothetical protein
LDETSPALFFNQSKINIYLIIQTESDSSLKPARRTKHEQLRREKIDARGRLLLSRAHSRFDSPPPKSPAALHLLSSLLSLGPS